MNLMKYHRPACTSSKVPDPPIVIIVDSDSSVRNSLELFVRRAGWQPRTAASAEEFLGRPRALTPSCLLLEARLPGLSGLELQELVRDRPELSIVFMSAHVDACSIVQAIKAGALEFLTKPLASAPLLNAIRNAIGRSEAALREHLFMSALRARYESLSRREREVMSLVVCGRLNKQVGGELGITEYTVKAHRRKVMRKMQASTYGQLINMVEGLRRTQLLPQTQWLPTPGSASATMVESQSAAAFAVIDVNNPSHSTFLETTDVR
jgi:FixJ family two-component response regulator